MALARSLRGLEGLRQPLDLEPQPVTLPLELSDFGAQPLLLGLALRVLLTKPFQLPARVVDRFQRPPRHPLLMPESEAAYKGHPLTNYGWASVGSTEVVVWSLIFLADLTMQTVDDLQGVNWRNLYMACSVFFLPWKCFVRGFRVDMNRLGEFTLERTRQKVRLIGLGLDEPKADFRGRRG